MQGECDSVAHGGGQNESRIVKVCMLIACVLFS